MKVVLLACFLIVFLSTNAISDDNLIRHNNLSIYQNPKTYEYKTSLFTSFKKATWFAQNIMDIHTTSDLKYNGYYTLTTVGKYITKKISIRTQHEKITTTPSTYYIGMGIDW